MDNTTVEWVALSEDIAIVACETGDSWFIDVKDKDGTIPFTRPMTGQGSRGSTGALLNGAVALGLSIEGELRQRALTLPQYLFDLIFSYHNARRAPGHFRRAADCFRALNRPEIASYLETHAREETGHERLAVKDLRALGLPAERIVANLIPSGMKPLCDYHDSLAFSDYPIGCIGYSYCFEYTAAFKGRSEVDAIEALWAPGIDASRFLRTHSALGSEAGHVDDIVDFVAGLPASDRIEIVTATYRTALALAQGLRYLAGLSDVQILAEIQAAAGEEIRLAA
jgi:hypothetical protein